MAIPIIDGLLKGYVVESRGPLPQNLVLEYPLARCLRATHHVGVRYDRERQGYVQHHVRTIDPVGS